MVLMPPWVVQGPSWDALHLVSAEEVCRLDTYVEKGAFQAGKELKIPGVGKIWASQGNAFLVS